MVSLEQSGDHLAQAHLLQLPQWAEFKSHFGWQAVTVQNPQAYAQILFRHLPLGFSVAYIPKGPLGTNWKSLWLEIDTACKKRKAVFLQVEPDLNLPLSNEFFEQFTPSFHQVEETIQPRRTVVIPLDGSEEDLLSEMKQKTRYNIRLAAKKGVTVHQSSDIAAFHEMMKTTGVRDGFAVHSLEYYQRAYDLFAPLDKAVLLEARKDNHTLAYLMLFYHGKRAWYFYGASDNAHRNLMPTYLLQWEAMLWAKAHGALEYDLWGIPDADEDELEAQFSDRSDGLWGVYRFKRGFGGQIVRSGPAFVKVYKPLLYKAYQRLRSARASESA